MGRGPGRARRRSFARPASGRSSTCGDFRARVTTLSSTSRIWPSRSSTAGSPTGTRPSWAAAAPVSRGRIASAAFASPPSAAMPPAWAATDGRRPSPLPVAEPAPCFMCCGDAVVALPPAPDRGASARSRGARRSSPRARQAAGAQALVRSRGARWPAISLRCPRGIGTPGISMSPMIKPSAWRAATRSGEKRNAPSRRTLSRRPAAAPRARRSWPSTSPSRAVSAGSAGENRRDREEELVDEPGGKEAAEDVRPGLGEDQPVAARAQERESGAEVDRRARHRAETTSERSGNRPRDAGHRRRS